MPIATCIMALLGQVDDAELASSQDLSKNDWQGLRTLLGQKVLSATQEHLGTDKTADELCQV